LTKNYGVKHPRGESDCGESSCGEMSMVKVAAVKVDPPKILTSALSFITHLQNYKSFYMKKGKKCEK